MVRGLNSSAEGELDWMGEFAKGTPPLCHPLYLILTHLRRFPTAVPDVTIV
jgi:uncharacterized protein YbgA (DUF1722 family)